MPCTAPGVVHNLAPKFLPGLLTWGLVLGLAGSCLEWELVGPLIGTTVPGTLGTYQRHPAIAGSLGQGGLSDRRWCMCVPGHVVLLVSMVVSIG